MERLSDKWTVVLIVVLMITLTTSISVAGYNFIYKDVIKNIKAMNSEKKQQEEHKAKTVKKKKPKRGIGKTAMRK